MVGGSCCYYVATAIAVPVVIDVVVFIVILPVAD